MREGLHQESFELFGFRLCDWRMLVLLLLSLSHCVSTLHSPFRCRTDPWSPADASSRQHAPSPDSGGGGLVLTPPPSMIEETMGGSMSRLHGLVLMHLAALYTLSLAGALASAETLLLSALLPPTAFALVRRICGGANEAVTNDDGVVARARHSSRPLHVQELGEEEVRRAVSTLAESQSEGGRVVL